MRIAHGGCPVMRRFCLDFAFLRCTIRDVANGQLLLSPPEFVNDKRNMVMIIAQIINSIRAYLVYRRNRAVLSALSDRDLADIGLDRSSIEFAARHAANA